MANQQVGTNKFSVAKWIIDDTGLASGATHTTFAGAIASAAADDAIFVKPGTYTENFTIDKSLKFMTGQARGNNSSSVVITGTVTQTAAATCTFNGFAFNTNSATIISITGVNAVQFHCFNCNFFLADGDGLTMDNANGVFSFDYCQFNQSADSLDIYNITACNVVSFNNCVSFNASLPGISTTAAGRVRLQHCNFQGQNFTTSASGNMLISFCEVDNGASIGLTTSGTGTSIIQNSLFVSTTAAVISVGAGTTLNVQGLTVDSTNANPITGAGTITYSDIGCSNTGNGIDVTTQTSRVTQLGKYRALGQPAFNALQPSNDDNVTGDGTQYILGDTDIGTALTERFDQGGDFVPGASGGAVFTAPITGKYQFNYLILLQDMDGTHSCELSMITSNELYTLGNYAAVPAGNFPMAWSVLADMDAADTITFTTKASDSTKTVDIFGEVTVSRTSVTGYLAC